jgi:hypothetical protein
MTQRQWKYSVYSMSAHKTVSLVVTKPMTELAFLRMLNQWNQEHRGSFSFWSEE